jgi:hypothetical protein
MDAKRGYLQLMTEILREAPQRIDLAKSQG